MPKAGASTDTKVPDAVPVANPRGNADTLAMYSKYAALEAKSGRTGGVSSAPLVVPAARSEDGGAPAAAASAKEEQAGLRGTNAREVAVSVDSTTRQRGAQGSMARRRSTRSD